METLAAAPFVQVGGCKFFSANSEAKFLHSGPSGILPIDICGLCESWKNVGHNAGTNVGHNAGTNVERHFCDTLPSHRDRVADDLEQPGRKKRMNDKKRHVLCFGLSLANVLKYSGWLDYH